MHRLVAIGVLAFLFLCSPAANAAGPDLYIRLASRALVSGDLSAFEPGLQIKISTQNYQSQVKEAGVIRSVRVLSDIALDNGHLVQGRTDHDSFVIYWTVGYSSQSQLIETLELNRAAKTTADLTSDDFQPTDFKKSAKKAKKAKKPKSTDDDLVENASKTIVFSDPSIVKDSPTAGMTLALIPTDATSACTAYPALCQNKNKDVRIVEFLFATTREASATAATTDKVTFTGSRAKDLGFGAARVRIPEKHETGHIELPGKLRYWGLDVFETKPDDKKFFSIKSVVKLTEADWGNLIKSNNPKEALVFVHGYNVSFEDSLYRNAQIMWDLQYRRGPSVLFTWASKGQMLDYAYDQQSALLARAAFTSLLRKLRDDYKIEKIHVLAHSMGNLIVLDALANAQQTQNPVRISELILAAPDVDRDYFLQIAANVRKITAGMTLYCSAADKAMIASRTLAAVPRAGDVPDGGPVIIPDIETIDVTAVGSEFLGLNHDVFASNRSVMNDIKTILTTGLRPPDVRGEARGVPEGLPPFKYWIYPP